MDLVSLHIVRSSASLCHHFLQPTAQENTIRAHSENTNIAQRSYTVRHILCLGSSAGIWFSHRAWCCLLSDCPVHSAVPAWSAAWNGSPIKKRKQTQGITVLLSKERQICTLTYSFKLLVAGAEPLPLAGDDGEQRVHLALWQLSMLWVHTWTWERHCFRSRNNMGNLTLMCRCVVSLETSLCPLSITHCDGSDISLK